MNNDIYFSQENPLLEAGPTFEVRGVELNPAQHGFTLVHNYALYFWRPYLGNTAFALWELLVSFCYGDCDTAYPSISRLARMLTNSDHSRAVVTGRRSKKGLASLGALGVLQRERLVQVVRRGQGPTLSYIFRVLKSLPLLRPEQVARLSPGLQRDHATWLERYGIDPQTYGQAYIPAAPALTSAVHALTPAGEDATAGVPSLTGQDAGSTNNIQEEDLMKNWWQEALSELRRQLLRSTYETCLLGTKVHSFQDGVLTLRAPGALAHQMLERRLATVVQRVLIAVSDDQVQQVRFIR